MIKQANDGTEPSAGSAALDPGLRERAEERLQTRRHEPLATLTPEAAERLLHELRVHQIELELQNEELHRAQDELALLHARYFDLYELAPVGYLTLSEAGVIQEANLAAATLFGVERCLLTQQRLTRFIHPDDQDTHYQAQRRLRSTRQPQSYALRLRREQPRPACWVSLEVCLTPEPQPPPAGSCRVILVDITARKRVEQALRDSQERLRLVTEIAEVSCWEWEPRTDTSCSRPTGTGRPARRRTSARPVSSTGRIGCTLRIATASSHDSPNSPPIRPPPARSSIGCGVGMDTMTGS